MTTSLRHPPSTVVELDHTTGFPIAKVCERCHVSEELALITVDASLGLACRLGWACRAGGHDPTAGVDAAGRA